MKRLDLRLPDEQHERLVELAQSERRSLNAQLLAMIDEEHERYVTAQGNYDNQMTEYRELRRRGLARLATDEGR
jgi:hypothetical protein